jgi:hypothetical protein
MFYFGFKFRNLSFSLVFRKFLSLMIVTEKISFFFTFSSSRDYIDLPTIKSQVSKAFLCSTCYPPSRLNLVTSWVLYFSSFRYQFYWLVYRSNVPCSGTQYSSYFCKAVTHSESDQARRCLPSLTRLNAHTLAVRHYTTLYLLYKPDFKPLQKYLKIIF